MRYCVKFSCLALAAALTSSVALADPCGMVPPIYQGQGTPITRIGDQQTFVFYSGGIESIVIRPGFSGKVEEFGMLIPFPTPPAIRKMPDHIFPHIAAAVDPPEVEVDLSPQEEFEQLAGTNFDSFGDDAAGYSLALDRDEVRVLREEAVGMYEVAVLAAGSAAALNKWMEEHGYRYPDGMDKVCEEYVAERWCFVAVKTQVSAKGDVEPQPGQRGVKTGLPSGATFDGNVQAMGFRFHTKKLVVPMRLSAFNDGELRNIVYLLTDGPRKIRSIPEEYVMRQVAGERLFQNVSGLLPLRVIGGTIDDIDADWRRQLTEQRNPYPHNGAAKEMFASDLQSVKSGELSLPQEEQEKVLLRIGERLGMRGEDIDRLNSETLQKMRDQTVAAALTRIEKMTLTVVDGDFPREVLAGKNLTFDQYQMPGRRNSARNYDATLKQSGPKKQGVLILGQWEASESESLQVDRMDPEGWSWLLAAGSLVVVGLWMVRRQQQKN